MSLAIASLNSGSNGNCYYIGNPTEAILVDAGLSCRETEKRMCRLGLSIDTVKAIFISHEHSDHIRGLCLLAKKYQLPVYISFGTLVSSKLILEDQLIRTLKPDEEIHIGELCVTAFPKSHDAFDPHSFLISYNNIRVGVFTDIGHVCHELTHNFSQCHAAFLEANYDDHLLETGRYPNYLKARIRGGRGHLSNVQALKLFKESKPSYMSHLILSHLSKDNNCPDLVHKLFSDIAMQTEIIVASRYQESEVYHIGTKINDTNVNKRIEFAIQGSLF